MTQESPLKSSKSPFREVQRVGGFGGGGGTGGVGGSDELYEKILFKMLEDPNVDKKAMVRKLMM